MFSSGPNYTKLKTNLRLAINRLKLLEKKKIELAQKSRKEIADYISIGKADRARIRVEHIIREDYMVEAMEMLEMYCDLLLARFGLIQQMKGVDPGLEEALASVFWAGPRLVADVPEMKPICDQILLKYGKDYAEKSKDHVNDKFRHRLGVQAPSKVLVENYLMEISKNFNVPFEPDLKVLKEAENINLVDLSDNSKNNLGGGGSGGGMVEPPGFRGFPAPPLVPTDFQPFNYMPGVPGGAVSVGGFVAPQTPTKSAGPTHPPAFNIPVDENIGVRMNYPMNFESPPPSYSHVEQTKVTPASDSNKQDNAKPKPQPRGKMSPPDRKPNNNEMFPELPSVPDELPNLPDGVSPNLNSSVDDIDFDDLNRRFENLKKSS